ncbi:MAG: HAD family phosphatase [Bdellovibrionota bacterium]
MKSIAEVIATKKLILWDFDGCFCDSEPIHCQAYTRAFAEYGHTINKAEYFETFTHTGGGIAKEIENYNLTCNSEEIRIAKAKYYWELISNGQAKLFPEISEILLKLQQLNIKSVIASNSSKKEIELILSHLTEKVSIEKIFGLQPGLRKKPFPDIFNHALSTLEISPKDALVIEDSERGLLAARDAQCDAIWVKTYLTEDFNSNAPHLGKITHGELLAVLNNIV